MQEHTITLKDGELAYRRAGEGPLVVLSHALGPVAWGSLDALTRSCSVAVPVWERSSIEIPARLAHDWFEPLVCHAGFENATLCAWSMAGPSAIEFAAERPASLTRLILVDVAGLGPDLPPLRLRDLPHFLLTQVRGRPTRGFVRIMWRNWVHRKDLDTAPLIDATCRFFRDEPGALMGPPDEDDDDESLSDLLALIDVPTLVLTGRHSTVLGPEHGRAAVDTLPQGELLVFEHSSHALQLEEPARFQDVVGSFVRERGGR